MNRVLDPRAMANDLIAARGQPALALGLRVRGPDLRQKPGREQVRQRPGVDLVVSSREHARSPSPAADWRSRPAARTAREPARPHGGARRFNDPFVGRMQLPAQPLQGRSGSCRPGRSCGACRPPKSPPRRRFAGYRCQSPSSSAPPVRSHAGAMGDTTPTDSRFPAQPGKSQRRPATNLSARLIV
jgi:hypothetical protein